MLDCRHSRFLSVYTVHKASRPRILVWQQHRIDTLALCEGVGGDRLSAVCLPMDHD